MKKAIFLCSNESSINRVYSSEIKEKLSSELEFPAEIINRENIDKYSDFVNDSSYIFSTWGMIALSGEEIAKYLKNAKAVFYAAGSVQQFAREYLTSGIKISSTWVPNGIPVAETAISQILLSGRGYFRVAQEMKKSRDWRSAAKVSSNYKGNYNAKVGLIGAGAVGRKVIELLKYFDIEIFVCDPYLSDDAAEQLGAKKLSLEEMFSQCDIISNHAPNLPATENMINKMHFALMKDYATFINTGRGQQIVEADMIAALKNNPTITALLDVTHPEPPNPDSELYTLENVFMSPHIAGSIGNEVHRMAEEAYREYKLFDAENRFNYEITIPMLETLA